MILLLDLLDLQGIDSPIGTFSDKNLKLVRRSRFAGPTCPRISCILLILDLAFQENLVWGDALRLGPCHGERCGFWLRMILWSILFSETWADFRGYLLNSASVSE